MGPCDVKSGDVSIHPVLRLMFVTHGHMATQSRHTNAYAQRAMISNITAQSKLTLHYCTDSGTHAHASAVVESSAVVLLH